MNPKIDFQLHEAFPDHRVTGRNCGADARVGAVFTALCRRTFSPDASAEEIVSPEAAFVSDISLRLDAVEWYGRSIDHVPSGHTARLTLSGDGFELVSDALVTAPDHTYYSLCIPDEPIPNSRNA